MTELEAMVALNSVPDIGPLRMARLVNRFGNAISVLSATPDTLASVEGIGRGTAAKINDWRSHCDPAGELALAEKAGVRVLTLASPDYPTLLREIPDPPPLLYVRGNVEALHDQPPNLAIVGTRRPSDYGRRMARHFGESAAFAGFTVVSGLARGIDTVTQEAAVDAGGSVVAVLGSGLGRVYPQDNVTLARRIAERGAVISEFPMRTAPSKTTFPVRNRLIAGLCRATLVVEAAYRSGALITAEQALEQGRTVLAVPGQADNPQARGCHALLRDGATLVERFEDVMNELGEVRGAFDAMNRENDTESNTDVLDTGLILSETERTLLARIDSSGSDIDGVVADTGLSMARVMTTITQLELRGLVERLPGNRIIPKTMALEQKATS